MIQKFIHSTIRRTHYWRDVQFTELSELYASNLLRSVALTIFMVFVPFYMFQNGYSIVAICVTFALFFVTRAFVDVLGAFMVARFGPKHTMIASCLLQIVNVVVLLTIPQVGWHPIFIALPWGASASLFFLAYHVEFSKIKHTAKAGHELGHMMAFEKVGQLLGPLVGGVAGSLFGAQYIFLVAAALLIASLWPLFLTSEPVKTRQKLDYAKLPVNKIKHDLLSYSFMGVENSLCINMWPFYVAVFLLSGSVYAQLGLLAAVGVSASIVAAMYIGKATDTQSARKLLRFGATANTLVYVARPFVQSLWGVFAVNIANDSITTSYRMPYIKGMYTAADDLPGFRIVYVSSMECIASIVKATVWGMLALIAMVVALKTVFFIAFFIAAVASLGIMTERFKVYNHK